MRPVRSGTKRSRDSSGLSSDSEPASKRECGPLLDIPALCHSSQVCCLSQQQTPDTRHIDCGLLSIRSAAQLCCSQAVEVQCAKNQRSGNAKAIEAFTSSDAVLPRDYQYLQAHSVHVYLNYALQGLKMYA